MHYMRIAAIAVLASALGSGGVMAEGRQNNLGIPVDLQEEVRDSFIFVLGNDVGASEVAGRANAMAAGAGGRVTHVYSSSIKGFAAKMPADAAARLAAQNPSIAYYEPDAIAFAFPKPPWAGGGGEEDTAACDTQEVPWGVDRVGGPIAGADGTAWVIDTGIDLDHPDLNVDVGRSANFVSRGKNSADDGNGHGTHVAGTIAAIDNSCDVVGVAAGATLVAVRVLGNNGSGSYSGVIAGIDYVAANGNPGDVANMSLGGGYSQALNEAVIGAAAAGVDFALAAGNESTDANTRSPASANGTGIYTVSAININDVFASFSNYGNPPIDCAAPGVNVLSSARDGGTVALSGTSMAAPHVAGLLLVGLPNYDGTYGYAIGDPDDEDDPICHDDPPPQ
jgi:subtilisin family serine protease